MEVPKNHLVGAVEVVEEELLKHSFERLEHPELEEVEVEEEEQQSFERLERLVLEVEGVVVEVP